MVSGFDDKTTKKGGSGGDEKTKKRRISKGYRPGEFVSSCCKKGRGESGSIYVLLTVRPLDRGFGLRLGELRLEVGDQKYQDVTPSTVIRNQNSMA